MRPRSPGLATLTGIALLFTLAAPALAEAQDGGEIVRAGCHIRTLEIDAKGRAQIAAECAWRVAPEAVIALLRNPAELDAALSTVAEARRLPDGRVLQVHSLGWPLDDRQITLDWRESALPGGGVRFDYAPAAKQEPLAKGRVQIVADDGHWEVRRDGNDGTRLSYTSHYDAGGSLKPFVVRRFQRDGIATSMEEMLAAAQRRR